MAAAGLVAIPAPAEIGGTSSSGTFSFPKTHYSGDCCCELGYVMLLLTVSQRKCAEGVRSKETCELAAETPVQN